MKTEDSRPIPTVPHPGSLAALFGALLGASLFGAPTSAQEAHFADFPFVIYCEYEDVGHAYYFSRVGADGRATYMTPDRQAGVIALDGVAERVDGDRHGSCSGMTLDELRAAGQAFDLPR